MQPWWFIGGGVAGLFAAAGISLAISNARDLSTMRRAKLLSVHDIERSRANSGPRGTFQQLCEITGTVLEGPDGPLLSHFGEAECVWYRMRVIEHYEIRSQQGAGYLSKTVYEYSSPEPITLSDENRQRIEVDLTGASEKQPENIEEIYQTKEPYPDSAPAERGIQVPEPARRTYAYEYKEWVIRAGQSLYVLGEARDPDGVLRIGKPPQDRFIISTQPRKRMHAERARERRGHLGCALLVLVLSIVLITIGILR